MKFVSLLFLEIAYNGSLKQCLTTRKGKTHEEKFGGGGGGGGANLAKQIKIVPKIRFFVIF